MENFNKNWLAIILIVLGFTAIGFLLGWTLKPDKQDDVLFFKHGAGMPGCCPDAFNIPLDDDDVDSLENVNVEVIVEKDGDVNTDEPTVQKKVIVKKVKE
jgi:hypothetical protein